MPPMRASRRVGGRPTHEGKKHRAESRKGGWCPWHPLAIVRSLARRGRGVLICHVGTHGPPPARPWGRSPLEFFDRGSRAREGWRAAYSPCDSKPRGTGVRNGHSLRRPPHARACTTCRPIASRARPPWAARGGRTLSGAKEWPTLRRQDSDSPTPVATATAPSTRRSMG